jgi:ribosomal protein S12 methylthiotransferase
VREVTMLSEMGVREVNLIAQDTTAYGTDIASPYSLSDLLVAISETGVEWVRVLYTHPAHVTEELLSTISQTEHIARYLDMPIQHISDRVLSAMGRGVSGDRIRELIGRARETIPGVSIRTSVIVGFPGETAAEFEELASFIAEGDIDHLGVFEYSPEPGTRAFDLTGHVPDGTSRARAIELVKTMEELTEKRGLAARGSTRVVLVDRTAPGSAEWVAAGRTEGQAWETDGEVLIESSGRQPSAGDFVNVRVTGAQGFDLEGVLVEPGVRAGRAGRAQGRSESA